MQTVHEFDDLNYKFSIKKSSSKPQILHKEFIAEMSAIDNILINHYKELEFSKINYFILSQDDIEIGYGSATEENGFITIYELFVSPKNRELGFGTRIFNEIRKYTK